MNKSKKMNYSIQYYNSTALKLIKRNYTGMKAKRFTINNTNQNLWIPNYYLESDGTIVEGANLDWLFKRNQVKHKIDISLGKTQGKSKRTNKNE